MATTFHALRTAMAAQMTGPEPTWLDLMGELWPAISSPLTWEAEELLLAFLRFEGRLRLTVSSDLPHSMPPEDMLKSLAVQSLGRWTGLAHVQEMERVQATTQSSSLSSLIGDVIRKTREEAKPRAVKEEVAVSSPEQDQKTVPCRLEMERGMWRLPGVRARLGHRERELAYGM